MLKQKITSLMLGLLIITSMACNSECDEPTKVGLNQQHYYVPYTGYDTLRFLHNNTDTQVFIGQGINYFWVRKPAFDDTQCSEDHQSLSIQFNSRNSGYTLTLYYVYDYWMFGNSNYLRFDFNNSKVMNELSTTRTDSIYVAGKAYSIINLVYFANQADTSSYLFYKVPTGGFGGVLQFKISNNDYFSLL